MSEEATPAGGEQPAAPAQASTPPPSQIQVDDTGLTASYANFCRVTGTPEEIILDFGLNDKPGGQPGTTTIKLQQRMVCNFYTAKRLLLALNAAIQRHEAAFGVLETDVSKRVRQNPNR